MSVKAGQGLFSLRQGQRLARFRAPLSGKVVRVNRELRRDPGMFGDFPYGKNWICVIEGRTSTPSCPN
jgi:glycine cleavage system H lipoate-binding protein